MNRPLVHPNLYKYKVPPTVEMINQVVEASGLTDTKFEFVHDMYKRSIKQARRGYRQIPIQHWHLFYEPGKKPPTYAWMFRKIQEEKNLANPLFKKKNKKGKP